MRRHFLSAILIGILLLVGCSASGSLSRELGVDIPAEARRVEYDSHGGFHGDGRTYLELSFDVGAGETLEGEIQKSGRWKALPLSENLRRLAENAMPQEGGYTSPATAALGYYRFIDRHSESTNPQDDAGVLGRPSCNYTLAVYDARREVLYYVALDT